MSKQMRMAARVTSLAALRTACDTLRSQGVAIVGPVFVENHPAVASGRMYDRLTGYKVELPGWRKPVVFVSDKTGGKLTGDIQFDNWSENFDNREIDPATGERIDGTGSVSPLVRGGQKEIGEDGLWGDHRLLQRLVSQCSTCAVVATARELGGSLIEDTRVEGTRTRVLVFEVPG